MSDGVPIFNKLADGTIELVEPDPPQAIYAVSSELLKQFVAAENARRRHASQVTEAYGRIQQLVYEPHLQYASTRQLLRETRNRIWNVERSGKKVRPLNGHGTWLPVYWIFGAADSDESVVSFRRFLREIDRPYRAGRGVGMRVPGGRLFEAGLCKRRNLEPDPDQYNEYDDPGSVDALQARPLDTGMDEMTSWKRPSDPPSP